MKFDDMTRRYNGTHLLHLALFLTAMSLFSFCAPQRPPVDERQSARERLIPANLQTEHLSTGFSVSWETNRRPADVISGYNIYISAEQSIQALSPHSPQVIRCLWRAQTYPGDTDPRIDFERAEIFEAKNGVLYFIHVRTVFADETIGEPSDEITIIPCPAGHLDLVPRFAGKGEGHSFAEQVYVPTRDPRNDLYLFVKSDSVFAASPHRLDRYLRYCEFHELGPSESIDDYPNPRISARGQTTIHLQVGRSYILSTPEACLAKFRVAAIHGTEGRTVVGIDYVYQSRCGYAIF